MASSSSPSPATSPSKQWIHDVFLSFRGVDTRTTFSDGLYWALTKAGVRTFRDSEGLRRGEDISAALMRAIEGSRISIVIFSLLYADSQWCLEELVKIMECRRTLGQLVFPVFYFVDPSDVRRQIGIFARPFQKFEARYRGTDKVSRWRAALRGAANLSGWHFANDGQRSHVVDINTIVEEICSILNNTYLNVAIYPVGMDHRIEDISKFLSVGLNDVRMVGIWGMGGIGKTTIAKAIYNKYYHSFEGTSFLANVRETAKDSNGIITLQERLLSDIIKPTKIEVGTVSRGINVIKERLGGKKVLVIVDDVDDEDHLNALAIRRDSFGSGSRIIITTRDRHLLDLLEVDVIHLTQEMKEDEALELFSWHAFQNHCPDERFLELSRRVVTYCGGLPLALEVLGSFLFKRDIRDWKSALEKLEKIPDDKIQKKLRISYDSIDKNQREIFLHISCFFIGMDMTYVIRILDGCGYFGGIGISVLLQRCLVTVSEKNKLMMHDLLREMGREVVREEAIDFPENRSRLWRQEDVVDVLTEGSGTAKTEGLALNLQRSSYRSDQKSFKTKAFKKMRRLKLLQLNYVQLKGEYKYLSKRLIWLCWRGFPLKFIPQDFIDQQNTVSIDLRHSNLIQVWENCRLLDKLKILNLSHSHHLTQSPDFSKVPNLEYLILKGCKNLSGIHQSIGHLRKLVLVNLKDCIMLEQLPRSFYILKSIESLVLSGCSRFEKLVEDIGELISLKSLLVSGTAISEVPSYIGRLKNLDYPSLQGLIGKKLCFPKVSKSYFPALPQGFTFLTNIDLGSCIFHSIPKLSSLSNRDSLCLYNTLNLPASSGLPTSLKEVEVDQCTTLKITQNSSEVAIIPGMDKSVHCTTLTHMERCTYVIAAVWQSMLQALFREFFIPSTLTNNSFSDDLVPAMRRGMSTLCTHSDPSFLSHVPDEDQTSEWTASGDSSTGLCDTSTLQALFRECFIPSFSANDSWSDDLVPAMRGMSTLCTHSDPSFESYPCRIHQTSVEWTASGDSSIILCDTLTQALFRECFIPSILANDSWSDALVPAMRGMSTLCTYSDLSFESYPRRIHQTSERTASGDGRIVLYDTLTLQDLFRECFIPSILTNNSSSDNLVPDMRRGTSTLCTHSDPSFISYLNRIHQSSEWTASGHSSILFPGINFTKGFIYVRKSDQVFFQVPNIFGSNLKAFTVSVGCSCFNKNTSLSGISIVVTNYTKLNRFVVLPTHLTEITSHEVILQVNLSNSEFNLKAGDFVEVEVVIGSGCRVNKTGVTLLWETPNFIQLVNGLLSCISNLFECWSCLLASL